MPDTFPDSDRPRGPLDQLLGDIKAALTAAQRWVKAHESEIATAIEGMIVWSRVSLQVSAVSHRYRGTEWEFLVERVDFLAASSLLVALDRGGSEGIAGVLERALGHPDALAPMVAALETVNLPGAQRKQLEAGLAFVTRREYELAVPLLIAPFEGVVHDLALRRQIIEPHNGKKHRFAEQASKTGSVGGIEDLLFEDLGFDGTFSDFLVKHVYGGSGNAYRHGFATDGYRERALLLATALLGWLDAVAEPDRKAEPLRQLLAGVGATLWIDLMRTGPVGEPPALIVAHDEGTHRRLLPAPEPSSS